MAAQGTSFQAFYSSEDRVKVTWMAFNGIYLHLLLLSEKVQLEHCTKHLLLRSTEE